MQIPHIFFQYAKKTHLIIVTNAIVTQLLAGSRFYGG